MAVPRLTKPADQHIIASIKEDNPRRDANCRSATSNRFNRMARITIARVENEAYTSEALRVLPNLLNERREELVWEVINRTEADIFE
jgi:hypothetical protein